VRRGGSLRIEWVPGHCNVEGNKKADSLAKTAVNTPPPDPTTLTTSTTYLLRQIKARHMENWKQMWDAIPIDLKGKSYIGEWKQQPDKLFYEDRIICSTITQLRTEHGHFASYLHKMGSQDNDRCACPSGTRETPSRLLFHCPRYSKDRLAAAKLSRIPLHPKAFLYRDIAHRALASLIRDTRLDTRLDRELKENERTGGRPACRMELVIADPLSVLGDEDDENWEEEDDWDDEPEEMPKAVLEDASKWLYSELGDGA
jgi:ribonuclease HI